MSDNGLHLQGEDMKRSAMPILSSAGAQALQQYATGLQEIEDLHLTTIRGYLSDLRQFAAWCEATWAAGREQDQPFTPTALTTPLLTRYRTFLQTEQRLKPASVNRALISIKRYCAWAVVVGELARDPAKVVKLVRQETQAPRHLSDAEEEALLAAVAAIGTLRDRTIIVFLLHTGLRAGELCHLQPADVQLGRRSGSMQVLGKGNKQRVVPLNATVRVTLAEYLPTLPDDASVLFPSTKTGVAMTERALGHLIRKYAAHAHLVDLSPHDLRHRFGYRMAEVVPLHRLAQIMGHDSLDTTLRYVQGTQQDLQNEVEKIVWQ